MNNHNDLSIKTDLLKGNTINYIEIENQKEKGRHSTYILKYRRKKVELKTLIQDTNLQKERHCLFMLDFILIKNNNNNNKDVENDNEKDEEFLLYIKCHEIAAIHFEDFYERIYSFSEIAKENKYFKALDNIKEIKEIIDYTLSDNYNDSQKIFIKLENNALNLHINLTYFDKIKEIILSMPNKILKDEEKITLLPMLLKEIQCKMFFYEKENKTIKKNKRKVVINDNTFNKFYDYYVNKEKEEENNKSCQQSIINETNESSNNNSLTSEEKKNKKEACK